jgi:signal transduction histidine kinase
VSNEPFDLAGVLSASASAFNSLSDQHALTAVIPQRLPAAFGDELATDIIVGQLLENAFKYSPEGGTVTVRVRVLGSQIEVAVADEGIGIAPGDHERIFERFVQGETGDRRRFGGIGLGLYIARRLARAQGGELTAASRPEGGAVMRLRLPRASSGD